MSLFDSGSKGIKFTNIGDEVTGTIAGVPFERQQTKFGTNEPDFWPDSTPKMQILVPLKTHMRDPNDVHDTGERTLYVASAAMKQAIGQAIRASGAQDLAPGGTLTVKFIGHDAASKNPAQPKKLYSATYTAPVSSFATGAPQPVAAPPGAVAQGPQQPVAQAPAAVPQVPQQIVAQPAPGGLNEQQTSQLAQLRAAGIPVETIAQALGTTVEAIAAHDAAFSQTF